MKREKFVFNKYTLSYEKVQISLKTKVSRGFAVFSAIVVFFFFSMFISQYLFDSPKETVLRHELQQMQSVVADLNKELDVMHKGIDNIVARDNGIRAIHELEPLDQNLLNAGVGGRDKYSGYQNLSDRELLQKAQDKISKLKNKIALSTESHNAIIEEFERKEDRMHAIPSLLPVREDMLNKDKNLMSGFGPRLHPVYKIWKMHTGMDFGARQGTPIYATGKGTVVRLENSATGYGRNIIISHGYGFETLYAHMESIHVKEGQSIIRGQQIGTVGSTGTSTAPHLHYEVIKNSEKVNPMPYCLDGLSPEQYQDIIERVAQSSQSFEF
jgi:murein DD-endopeptidase MepM/ murein hydrolase activator NlpD